MPLRRLEIELPAPRLRIHSWLSVSGDKQDALTNIFGDSTRLCDFFLRNFLHNFRVRSATSGERDAIRD